MIPAKRLKLMLEEPVKCRNQMWMNMITITLKGFFGWGLVWCTLVYDIGQTQQSVKDKGTVWIKTWIKIVILRVGSPIPSKNPSKRWLAAFLMKVKNSSHGRSLTVHVGSRNLPSLQSTRKGSSQLQSRIGALHQLCFKEKGRGQTAVLFQLSKIVT